MTPGAIWNNPLERRQSHEADPALFLHALSNGLPATAGNFNLTKCLNGPETPILDGSYRLPAVYQVQ